MIDRISEHIRKFYSRRDYPALAEQLDKWRQLRPFAGTRLLDATPVYTNTLVKYLPLVAGGAELAVGVGEYTPVDRKVLDLLRKWGFRIVAPEECAPEEFDVIMDCAGMFAAVPARCGYVELTRSGAEKYRDAAAPVFFADAGRIKLIETTLGTGEGCVRALRQSGYDLNGKRMLIFGSGKVGRGIALYGVRNGAQVTLADFGAVNRELPPEAAAVEAGDRGAVAAAIRKADFIVSATGVAGALAEHAAELNSSHAVIANMGVLDEFGPELPPERVLNSKRPLNFILDEPTHLRFIDPTMALDNAGALEVLHGDVKAGVHAPASELESAIIETVRRDGAVARELSWMEDMEA